MLGLGIGFFAVLVSAFFATQVAIFKALPRWLKNLMVAFPLFGLIANFAFSGVIMFFTGIGAIAGIVNVVSSVFVGIYFYVYANAHKIIIEKAKWKGLIPYWEIVEQKKFKHWLF